MSNESFTVDQVWLGYELERLRQKSYSDLVQRSDELASKALMDKIFEEINKPPEAAMEEKLQRNSETKVDYSAVEMRMAQEHLDAMHSRDLHREIAANLFEIPQKQVNKQQRYIAKQVVFGRFYGQPQNLSTEVTDVEKQMARAMEADFLHRQEL